MKRERLPAKVPLLDVSNYTDQIVFGNLGLPIGFDEQRLEVRLRAVHRDMRAAGIGRVSIISVRPELSDVDYDVTSISSQGTATLAGVGTRKPQPIGTASLSWPTANTAFDRPDAVIEVNTSEVEEQIREDGQKYDKSLFDTFARADYLNKGLRQGLRKAALAANVDMLKTATSLMWYGILGGGAEYLGQHDPTFATGAVIAAGGTFHLATALMEALKTNEPAFEAMRRLRMSVFYGCAIDRYAATLCLLGAQKLITAKP